MERLSPHFTLDEFIATQHRNINNALPTALMAQARETCAMMERIREHLGGVPISITSGFRCIELNRAIGSDDSSDHVRAMAVDFKAPGFGTPFEVATELAAHADALGLGQLIHEYGFWVHVSTRMPAKPINRIITYKRGVKGALVGIQPA